MSATTLKTQTKQFSVILNKPNDFSLKEFTSRVIGLCEKLTQVCIYYALIYHDKDVKENGELKTLHCHMVLMSNHIVRLETMLYRIANYLGYDESLDLINTIQIDKCENVPASIQYLTHKNNKDKYQYLPSLIDSNLPVTTLSEYYYQKLTTDTITMLTLIDWVLEGYTDIEIMCFLGASRFRIYEYCLKEIRKKFNTPEGIVYLKGLRDKLCNI